MDSGGVICKSRDLLSSPRSAFLMFWLPAIAMVVAGGSEFSDDWRTGVWTLALGIMGAGCIANALRCGRIHCYVTGPFFLLMALITLLYGLGVARLGQNGWNKIGLAVLVGAVVLCYLPEMLLGRYRKSIAAGDNRG